jgi:hypothetical protein
MTYEYFTLQDYAEIDLANGVGFEHWNLVGGVLPVLKAMEASKTFWTVRDEEGILGIGGFFIFYEGVCEASFFPSRRFCARPLALYRVLKQELARMKEYFRRVQLNCRDEEVFVRFAKSLGFIEEGRLRKFGREERDHLMMAIVR